jgi:hypothetical protein
MGKGKGNLYKEFSSVKTILSFYLTQALSDQWQCTVGDGAPGK